MDNKIIASPRCEIEAAISSHDLPELLRMAGMLHGHFCPFLAIGVKAAARAVTELNTRSTGMEEVIAIIETNNCFADGVQFVTGCTLGNNALFYRDYGKVIFTLAHRTGDAVRIAIKVNVDFLRQKDPEAVALFLKVVKERRGTTAEKKEQKQQWAKLAFNLLELPDESIFSITTPHIDIPGFSKIFPSIKCARCGELIMETHARFHNSQPACIPCAGQPYYQLSGDGMSIIHPL